MTARYKAFAVFAQTVMISILICASPAAAKTWQVVAEKSHINFSGIYTGSAFKGEFKKWTAKISFDPANLDTSSADVEIDVSSAATGNFTYDKTLLTSDWFNVKQQPTAHFSVSKFSTKEKAFLAEGTLTLRGKTVPILLDFTFEENADGAKLLGLTSLNRLDFDIGKSSDPTGDWVKLEINVEISVELEHASE